MADTQTTLVFVGGAIIVLLALALVILGRALVKAILLNQTVASAIALHDEKKRTEDMRERAINWERLGKQSAILLENRVNDERAARGEPPFPVVAAVKPEHQSPPTEDQRAAADLQTWKARVVRAALELGEDVPEINVH